MKAKLPKQAYGTNPVVLETAKGKLTDSANSKAVDATVKSLKKEPGVVHAVSPLSKEGAAALSKDKQIGYISVTLSEGPSDLTKEDAQTIIDATSPASDAGLTVATGGYLGQAVSKADTESSEAVGLTAAVVILLFVFGTATAMLLPIVSAVLGLVASLALIGFLGHAVEVPTVAPTLAAMIGLGVGIDYALFIVTRHKLQLQEGVRDGTCGGDRDRRDNRPLPRGAGCYGAVRKGRVVAAPLARPRVAQDQHRGRRLLRRTRRAAHRRRHATRTGGGMNAAAVFVSAASRVVPIVVCIGALFCGASASAAPAASGRLLVGFEKGVSKERQERILSAANGRFSRRFAAIRGGRLAVVRPRSGKATDTLRKRLRRTGGVAYAEPDFFQFASAEKTPDDPFYTFDYALVDSPDDHDIDAPSAWGTRTSCAKVAILDTGIDTDHPDLASNVYKSSDKPNNGKDDDKNGYVDDTYGFNAINGKGSGEDDNGHGTHVSGIVAGRGNNGNGSSGVCWSAKLIAVKFMNSKGKGSTSAAIDGIDYAVKTGAKIVNCSFGSSSKSSALHDAVDYAQDHNVLLVVAAGNDSENIDKAPTYPASFSDSNILAVAASTSDDTLASFSNYGSEDVDVAAPGDSIFSTYLGGGYKVLSGTSMAAPYTAGTAALLRKQESDATYGNLRYAIRHKVDKPPALAGKVAYDGRLNVQKALAAIASLVD